MSRSIHVDFGRHVTARAGKARSVKCMPPRVYAWVGANSLSLGVWREHTLN